MPLRPPIPEFKETAARLRKAMKANGLTHRTLADKLNLSSPSTVYTWTNAHKSIASKYLTAVAEAVGVSPNELTPATRPVPEWRRENYENRAARGEAGPASRALAAFKPEARTPTATENFGVSVRTDGTMTIRLNLTLPIAEGMTLVQTLFAAGILLDAGVTESE